MERLEDFTKVRQAFAGVQSPERSDERVTNITDILLKDNRFVKLGEETCVRTLARLDFLRSIQWKNPIQPIKYEMLQCGSEQLQDTLILKGDPFNDLSPNGSFWTSDKRSELSDKLQIGHSQLMNDLRRDDPDTALAADAIGTAAHWTARNAGATWTEAVEASRYAEAALVPNSYQFIAHEIVINLMAARHGGFTK